MALHDRYMTFDVLDFQGENVTALIFLDVAVQSPPGAADPLTFCGLALNLQTNVPGIPQPASRIQATCYPRFGVTGASAALLAAPFECVCGP